MRYLFAVAALVCLAAFAFLVMDIRHRVTGYRAASGSGIVGLAAVTRCEWHRTGGVCFGDFVSADGRVRRPGVRINGAAELLNWGNSPGQRPPPAGTKVRAALPGPAAAEAWTLDGSPWTRFSATHLYMLLPVVLAVVFGRSLVRGGFSGWRHRRHRALRRRVRRDRRRMRGDKRRVRRGQVH